MIAYLKEVCDKLWNIGKLVIPGVALWEFISTFFGGLWDAAKAWIDSILADWTAKIAEQMSNLQIDLTPPPAFAAFVAKVNVIIPLTEMWDYLLIYLACASFLVGIKWFRNLVPGLA